MKGEGTSTVISKILSPQAGKVYTNDETGEAWSLASEGGIDFGSECLILIDLISFYTIFIIFQLQFTFRVSLY